MIINPRITAGTLEDLGLSKEKMEFQGFTRFEHLYLPFYEKFIVLSPNPKITQSFIINQEDDTYISHLVQEYLEKQNSFLVRAVAYPTGLFSVLQGITGDLYHQKLVAN